MKKIFINHLMVIFAITLVTISSCKDALLEKPNSFVTPEQFFKSENQCIAALNSCYTPFTNIYGASYITAIEAVTDLGFLNNIGVDAKMDISPASPGMGKALWSDAYRGIMYCNSAIAGIDRAPVTDARKLALKAEGITLRAMYYYILTSTFGDVPYYTDDVSTLEAIDRISQLPRMSAFETRKTLMAELQQIAPNLPAKRTSEVAGNRVSAPMAYMLIAKMAVWNKDWAAGIAAVKEIQKIYGLLSQYPLTDTYFRNKNTPESIFEIQYLYSAAGIKKTTTVAATFTPTHTANTDIYDGVSVPELGTKANPYGSVAPTEYLMSLYQVDDPRRNMILAYSYNGKNFNRPASANGTGKPWMGPKFWCPLMENVSDGNNQKVFRYADALLLMAECANETGDQALALASINEVKGRASASYIMAAYPGKDQFFDELKKERARELMGEYTRKYDLVRWGIWYESVKATSATEFAALNTNVKPYHEYYPISDSEVARSAGRLTNTAYTGQ